MLLAKANGQTDAWDIRWAYSMYLDDGLVVRPTKSLLYNIGFDGTRVHCGIEPQDKVLSQTASLYDSDIYDIVMVSGICVNKAIQKSLQRFFHIHHDSWYVLLKRRIKKIIKSLGKC